MPRVRCITMQKDEGLLLDAWLRYHGYLFGFENLEVLDNGSRDPLTCDILERFEAVGVTIHRQHVTVEAFEAKGGIISEIIRGWDHDREYDFALPCDTDEFLALFTPGGLSCQRGRIDAALSTLVQNEQALAIEISLFNVPGQPGWFHLQRFPKGFLPSRSIQSMDSGFHFPQTRQREGLRHTDFTYLHFHNKPYELLQAHTRRKLYRRVDLNDLVALRGYRGAGAHMTKNLLMSREEYLRQYDRNVTARFEGFGSLLRALGANERMIVGDDASSGATDTEQVTLRLPPQGDATAEQVAFDGEAYLADNPDVSRATSCGLSHYLYFGFQEGRRLRRPEPHQPATALELPAEVS